MKITIQEIIYGVMLIVSIIGTYLCFRFELPNGVLDLTFFALIMFLYLYVNELADNSFPTY